MLCLDVTARMVIVVKSAAENFMKRELLRRTWASLTYVNGVQFTIVFVIGKKEINYQKQLLIDEEQSRYGDILQLNISDKYRYFKKISFSYKVFYYI